MSVEVGEQMVRVSDCFPPCGTFNLWSHLVAINLYFHHSCCMSYPICRLRHREHAHCIMGQPRSPFRTGLIGRITRAEDLGLQIPVWARQQTLQGVEGPAPFSQSFAHLPIILGVLHLWPAGTQKPSDGWEGNRRKKSRWKLQGVNSIQSDAKNSLSPGLSAASSPPLPALWWWGAVMGGEGSPSS